MSRSIWIGYDPREIDALKVCVESIKAHLSEDIPIFTIDLEVLQKRGLYQRPMKRDNGQLFDVISDAPMSTEFAISRFFVPHLANENDQWAVFMDCDMLIRADLVRLFECANHQKAVQVVKHEPSKFHEGKKMDGQIQTVYPRKNWSSVILWNLKHPTNRRLTLHKLNQWAGRSLHNFDWIDVDSQIGELPNSWNHLVGIDPPSDEAQIAHFTLGIPRMAGYEDSEFADEWNSFLPDAP